jgi:ABC-type multidrug transport system ATPase subunit
LNNLETKSDFNRQKLREVELSKLKSKIVDAIRFSERYWMIFREQTFGIATIIDLFYKKSYIEILFFTNTDVLQKGLPLIKIHTPSKTTFNFNEVLIDPEFDEDGFISPAKIIERVNNLIAKEINYHLTILNYEIELLNENFENYPIGDNPFFRKIHIYYPNYVVKLRINFENYPEIPYFPEKKQLIIKRFREPLRERIKDKIIERYGITTYERIGEEIEIYDVKDEVFIEKSPESFIKKLRKRVKNKINALLKKKFVDKVEEHTYLEKIVKTKNFRDMSIIENWNRDNPPHIIEVIESIINIRDGSQHLIVDCVSIPNKIYNLSFKIHRGQSVGIFYESDQQNQLDNEEAVGELFRTIAGITSIVTGNISIFENQIKSENKYKIEGIYIATEEFSPKIEGMPIKKAIIHDLYLIGKRKTKKKLVDNALESTGLLNRKNEKISKLNKLDRILFSISRALIRKQQIIMISISPGEIGRLESEQFNRYIEKIKRKFHVIILMVGPESIVSNCDKIITIKNKQAEIGSLKYFISKMPYSGEIITIELEHPEEHALENMFKIESALFIEERKNERYKIFCTEQNPNTIISKLMNAIGPHIYNFHRHKATLEEYLEFLKIESERV